MTKAGRALAIALAVLCVVPVAAASAGERIVYTRGSGRGLSDDLFSIRPDGSGQRRLTRGRGVERLPQWSPDRSQIVFERGRDEDFDVWIMNADGSNERRLTSGPRDDIRPQWSPDGRWIAWLDSPRDKYIGRIRLMRPDGSGKRLLVKRAAASWEWSPDGSKIAFARRDLCSDCPIQDYEVTTVDVGTGSVRRLTRNRRTNDGDPHWSPDGRRLIFVRYPMRRYPRLYTMRADGARQRKLVVVRREPQWPEWSPDGRKILVGLRDDDIMTLEHIVLVNVSTGRRRLVTDASWGFARWSPNGRRIAYTAPVLVDGEPGHGLLSIGRDGKGRRRIDDSRHAYGLFDW